MMQGPLVTKGFSGTSWNQPSADALASLRDSRHRVSGRTTRAAGPSTEGWFNPGKNMKKRGLLLTAASSSRAATHIAPPLRCPQKKEEEKVSKSTIQGSATSAKQSSTISAKSFKQSPLPTKATVSTNGRVPAVKPSVTAAVDANDAKRRAQAVIELKQLIGGDREESRADRAPATVAVPATSEPSTKVTALVVALENVGDTQREVDLLTSTAAVSKTDSDNKKAHYFEAPAHALELAIAREATRTALPTALNDAIDVLPTLEYEYHTAGAAATRAAKEAASTSNMLLKSKRCLARITPREKPTIGVAVNIIMSPAGDMPAVTAEKIRDRSRSMVQRFLSSYVRRKRGIKIVPSKAAPCTVPPEAGPQDSTPPDIRPTGSPDSETFNSHDLDVTMADSTFTFGNCHAHGRSGWRGSYSSTVRSQCSVTSGASSGYRSRAKASSGNIAELEMGDYRLMTRPIGTCEDPGTQLAIRYPMDLNCPHIPHDQTLRATWVHNVPDFASAVVAAAAVPERHNQLAANTAVICKWVNQRKVATALPATIPIGLKVQFAWIHSRALELAARVRDLPYPVDYLDSMPGETHCAFGHSINSES
uniref:Uncharacterized protein n=1 Tax=Hyaloperonospora arabidopsidis (strain Emoy2) TaxID=559515 RepID=M4BU54_HYAAE